MWRSSTRWTLTAVPVSVGGAVMLAGLFGPWVRSGAASRSSFEMADLIDRLGFASAGPVAFAIRTWPMAPLLIVSAVVAAWWRPGWPSSVLAVIAGATVGGVGLAVSLVPETALLGVRWGSSVTAVGGIVMMLGGVAGVVGWLRRRPAHVVQSPRSSSTERSSAG